MKPRDYHCVLITLLCLVGVKTQYQTYRFECHVSDPLSCDQSKNEVCTFKNGGYSCECPQGVSRTSDDRCIVINECAETRLNDCHENARCIDLEHGYTCECQPGYADISENVEWRPGRICQAKVNECADPSNYIVDCGENADCQDTPESFTCVCKTGYIDISALYSLLPGRKCVKIVDECFNGINDCSSNADCIDQPLGYICKCKNGFVDASPNVTHYPGRQCIQPKVLEYVNSSPQYQSQCHPVLQPSCSMNQVCSSNPQGMHMCKCAHPGIPSPSGGCITFNRCEQHQDCDPAAICSNTYDSYKCQCRPGYLDISPDPVHYPGRKCQQLINECGERKHDCSPYATCVDTLDAYICRCNEGFTDVSSRYSLKPGRRCAKSGDQCSDRSLNSCDENADCVTLPDGYTCSCAPGYVDVSSNANLPPGRVCTLQTQCPAQPTDLVFLIDGSGSIGSDVFRQEVLRFVKDFIELFEISSEQTRVAVVQYSDRIRHEFDLNQYPSQQQLKQAIDNIEYLTGLTRTGAAIEHVVNEAFSDRRGARPLSFAVPRVCIVITDGRSQDNVTRPVLDASKKQIQLYAVGVTNHVLDSELESIAGSKSRTFHVNAFEDLNARLRSAIQKVACPGNSFPPYSEGPCDPTSHRGCDRSLNQICVGQPNDYFCTCPPQFEKHPITGVCGGILCNPQLVSSCPYPEICQLTPFGNYRCTCAGEMSRDSKSGTCRKNVSTTTYAPDIEPFTDECSEQQSCHLNEQCISSLSGRKTCQCLPGYEVSPADGKCQIPGTCHPSSPESCDQRKHEECLPDASGGYNAGRYTCQCGPNHRRHPVTGICLVDECAAGTHRCHLNAKCIDTDESYICTCREGYIDESPNPSVQPGRVCREQVDECARGLHNCSVNAYCIDLTFGFMCRCKENYIDFSPNPQHFGGTDCKPLVDECTDRDLNTCSENAICIDTMESYKCQCKSGFIDHDELRNPGRICEKANRLCTNGQNDCHQNARCIAKGSNDYTCVCHAGFMDKSRDPSKTGRVCVERICIDPSKHDCHMAAICTEVQGPERYTCACRNGYIDGNPSKPGRDCKVAINECLDTELNDCDPTAQCHDLKEGYTCTCPPNSKDISSDPNKPGRKCFIMVNECSNPNLNNCSRFADCIDKEDGYECKCKPDYHDNNPATPGIDCTFIINECESPNLNNCNSHAKCIDTLESYRCECIPPYVDKKPERPGTDCRYNECEDPNANDCDKNATCIDTDDGYKCQCNQGFYDNINDLRKPGRACVALPTHVPHEDITLSPNLLPCGITFCHLDLAEVCIGNERCDCRPNEGRASPQDKCVLVEKVPIEIRVISDNGSHLTYSTIYGNTLSPRYVEIVDKFITDIGNTIKKTQFAPQYVTATVDHITTPKVKNSSWDTGLLFSGTVDFIPSVDICQLWRELLTALEKSGHRLGNGDLGVAVDVYLLDPCRKEEQHGFMCGTAFCRDDLGEICIAGKLCGCPNGMKRAGPGQTCRTVETWTLPLWVIRDGNTQLQYSSRLANPHDVEYKRLVSAFEKGIADSYAQTPLRKGFVVAEVNDIVRPSDFIKAWDHGILYNFTVNFIKGSVAVPSTVFTDLLDYITQRNNFEVGRSGQYISQIQANPFDICYKSSCHPEAICTSNGPAQYTCSCPNTHRDLQPSNPGHNCIHNEGINECEKSEWNECDPHARCIDENHLYRCECIPPYVNAAPEGQLPGSVCRLDYCAGTNYCPANTTCKSNNEQVECICLPGYVDIRPSPYHVDIYGKDVFCLLPIDVDECALGLTNCSAVAICTNLRIGYECRCPEGYTDGDASHPGRVCAALLCGLCNGHGDCVYDAPTNNVTCKCAEGYTGEHCENAPSIVPLIVFLILASILLLLALCCCLYFCSKTRCFRTRRVASSDTSAREILGSDYYSIPRAKLKRRDEDDLAVQRPQEVEAGRLQRYLSEEGRYGEDEQSLGGSSASSAVEIERRVITDVTTHEIKTTTYHDADGGTRTFYEVTANASAGGDAAQSAQFSQSPVEQEAEQYAAAAVADGFVRSGTTSRASGNYVRSGSAMGGDVHYSRTGSALGGEHYSGSSSGMDAIERHYTRSRSSAGAIDQRAGDSYAGRHTADYGETADYEITEQNVGDGVLDRTTKLTTHHDFVPEANGRGGTERRRNEFVTTTRSQETSYR